MPRVNWGVIGTEHRTGSGMNATNANRRTMSDTGLTIVVVALALLTFLGILSETSLNIAYSTLMAEFSISADVVQ